MEVEGVELESGMGSEKRFVGLGKGWGVGGVCCVDCRRCVGEVIRGMMI